MKIVQTTIIIFLSLIPFFASSQVQVLEIRDGAGNSFYTSVFPSSNIRMRHIEAENDIGPTPTQFEIKIGNLAQAPGTAMDIVIFDVVTNASVVTYTVNVNFVNGYNNMITTGPLNASLFAGRYGFKTYGIAYRIVGAGLTVFQTQFFTLERTTKYTDPILGMPFKIHYADDFFTHPGTTTLNNYLTDLRNAIRESWDKEVNDWGLCLGVPAQPLGGSAANMPRDADNVYHIVVHSMGAILGGMNNDHYRAKPEADERCIIIDSDLSPLTLTPIAISPSEHMYSIISHEFFHGIQFSHMSNIDVEMRKWMIEGQARFLETVFMPSYSVGVPNRTFVNRTSKFDYSTDVRNFINYIYDDGSLGNKPNVNPPQTAYIYPSLHQASYQYCIFWRHLFEHHFPPAATTQTKLNLLRQTLISQNALNNSDFATIETIMDNNLNKKGGINSYETFDDALKDFTEKLYFHNSGYNIAANKAILNPSAPGATPDLWDDPNPAPNDNFYSRITTFNEPVENFSTDPFSYQITSSFGHRAHRYRFTKNANVTIEFTGNSTSEFHVDCYLIDDNKTIYDKKNIAISNVIWMGSTTIQLDDPNKYIVVLVTRLDANEGTADDNPDYDITLSQTPIPGVDLVYNWPTPSTSSTGGIFFGIQPTLKGLFGDFRTIGGIKDFCKGIEIQETVGTNVYALEGGIASVDGNSVNIGKFRYANIDNIVLSDNDIVNAGEIIGKIPAAPNNHLYFMECNVPLTSAGETLPAGGKWLNPLRNGQLIPFADVTDPVINNIQLVDAAGANIVNPLFQKLDIIVDAYDPAPVAGGGGHASLKCGIHKITVKFFDASGGEIFHSDHPPTPTQIVYYPSYDASSAKFELPQGVNAVNNVYHGNSTPTQFVYIATNKPYDANPDQYWNTLQKDGDVYTIDAKIPSEALFKDGEIRIEVTVEDFYGNSTTQSI